MAKLRIGILVDAMEVDAYVHEICAALAARDTVEAVILTGHLPAAAPEPPLRRIARRLRERGVAGFARLAAFSVLRRAIRRLELGRARAVSARYGTRRSLEGLGLAHLPIAGEWSGRGLYFRLDAASAARLREASLDVILRGGSGILKGEILTVARHGLWSFHHGDNRAYRGAPSGFWEVLEDAPTSGFVIQRLTEELDGGAVLLRGNLMTQNLWLSNDAFLQEKSNAFLLRLLDDLARGRPPRPETDPAFYDRRLFALRDDPAILARYMARTYPRVLARRLREALGGARTLRWSVAAAAGAERPLFRHALIPNPPGRMLADPFVITKDGTSVCFVEDLFYDDDRGRISALELGPDGPRHLGVVLDEPFHLSYPFVFEAEGETWMIPETGAARQIRLYRATDFPTGWTLHRVLMEDVQAADTGLIGKDGRWYMLTNICSAGMGDHNSELHVFHGPRFDGTDWTPVACGNPVIFDAARARNGGLFRRGDDWIRVNQIQGKGHYGAGFSLNVIETLSPEAYAERRIATAGPGFVEGGVSTHHFHTDGRMSVVDVARPARMRDILAERDQPSSGASGASGRPTET